MNARTTTPQEQPAGTVVPPTLQLQPGDHLSRAEFERRYDAMPHLKKAELIEGVVYMPSPVTHRQHGKPHFDMIGWLSHYVAGTPGTEGGDNSSLKLDMQNEPQPDAFVIVQPQHHGQVRLDEEGYIVGAPELVAEVSASSASYDLHSKLRTYRRNGVREYVVWRVLDGAIDWFILEGDEYQPLAKSPEGWYRSRVFPGLWLDPIALLAGRLLQVFEAVQLGLASDEHRHFVARAIS